MEKIRKKSVILIERIPENCTKVTGSVTATIAGSFLCPTQSYQMSASTTSTHNKPNHINNPEMFVVLPMAKYQVMNRRQQTSHLPASPTPTPSLDNKSQPPEELSAPPKAQPPGPNVAKQIRGRQIKKFLERLDTYPTLKHLDNIDALVKDSLGNSRSYLDNEKLYYQTILDSPLASRVRNRHKIAKYLDAQEEWFKI